MNLPGAGAPRAFVLATFNRGKLGELSALLADTGITLTALGDLPGAVSPPETAATLIDNAREKARAALAFSGQPAIADDTGLEVDALGGRPGVHSARYAGPEADDARNVARLLDELRAVEPARRTARFRTVMIACFPDGAEIVAEGVLEGVITSGPRGTGGFGYDPVFELPALDRTLAELSAAEKNGLSHRARAAIELKRRLFERVVRGGSPPEQA